MKPCVCGHEYDEHNIDGFLEECEECDCPFYEEDEEAE